jgi:hypothetical protein
VGSDILFEAKGFNATEAKLHFINPECFGEDAAAWLKAELTTRGHPTTVPDQEDWGWYVEVRMGKECYFIGIGAAGRGARIRDGPSGV